MALSYEELINYVGQWYNTDADGVLNVLNQYGVEASSYENLMELLPKDSYYRAVYNANGTVRGYNAVSNTAGYSQATQAQQVAQAIDSNIHTSVSSGTGQVVQYPMNTNAIPVEGTVSGSSPTLMTKVASAASQTLQFVTGEVLPAVAAAATGISLGKSVEKILYDTFPDFFNDLGWETMNPDTWNSITSGDDSFASRVFNTIFGLNPETSETTMYLDSEAIAYIMQLLHERGVFDTKDPVVIPPEGYENVQVYIANSVTWYTSSGRADATGATFIAMFGSLLYGTSTTPNSHFTVVYLNYPYTVNMTGTYVTPCGTTVYYGQCPFTYYPNRGTLQNSPAPNNSNRDFQRALAAIYCGEIVYEPEIDGLPNQDDATIPDFPSLPENPTPQDYLRLYQDTYPDAVDNQVTQDVVQPDGSTKTYYYYPVPYPNIEPITVTEEDPETGEETQTIIYAPTSSITETDPETGEETETTIYQDTLTVPDTAPQTQTQPITDSITSQPTEPPPTGTGSSPETVAVTGSASSLWAVYNPTQSEVNAFGAWLWSPNFVDQLLKLFNDPMQSIIGIHKVFASPHIGGTRTIVVGYLDSGVSSKYVSSQYTTVDCGTVNLSEVYQNVYDYSPYTEVSIYLPFIGIHQLDVGDVMRSSISVIYHVDVISGACLAEVKVTRDSNSAVLYQYSGNASVTYPISSGSYMGMVSAVASIAGAAIATVASGGSALPLAVGAANAALNANTRVSHSGSFSGNAGAMGCKTPYLIITRPQTAYADGIETLHGIGASSVLTVGECTGFIQASDVDLTGIAATNGELSEIRTLLLSGIYV